MVAGWNRQMVRANRIVLYVLYADLKGADPKGPDLKRADSDGEREIDSDVHEIGPRRVELPRQSVIATPESVLVFVRNLVLRREGDVQAFVEMLIDAWDDAGDLRAGREPRERPTRGEIEGDALDDEPPSFEVLREASAHARSDSIIAKLEGAFVNCDGVSLRTPGEVRAFSQRLVATWRIVQYLRAGDGAA